MRVSFFLSRVAPELTRCGGCRRHTKEDFLATHAAHTLDLSAGTDGVKQPGNLEEAVDRWEKLHFRNPGQAREPVEE
jgi:hypothetical protein